VNEKLPIFKVVIVFRCSCCDTALWCQWPSMAYNFHNRQNINIILSIQPLKFVIDVTISAHFKPEVGKRPYNCFVFVHAPVRIW
jgi:hypothetical protein